VANLRLVSTPILIYGSRMLARLARDVLESQPELKFAGYVDDVNEGHEILGGLDHVAADPELSLFPICPAIGYSNQPARWQAIGRARARGFKLRSLIHESVYLGRASEIAEGCLLLPRAIVDREARLGTGTLMWPASTVAHECVLGDNVVICSHAIVAGNVRVGAHTFIGIGASIVDNVTIGEHCFIGAGVIVFESLPDHTRIIARPNGLKMPR
jgi:sugar O-acyltransferase (sialic acid O-acetyltransferase NeuD family)